MKQQTNNSIVVRAAQIVDLEVVLDIYRHLHRSDLPLDRKRAKKVLTRIVESPALTIFLLEENAVVKASCYLNVIDNLTRGGAPYGIIENVVTHSDHRHRGFAKAVLRFAMEEAWRQGCYKVMLMTGQKELVSFYEKCGFDPSAKHALLARP